MTEPRDESGRRVFYALGVLGSVALCLSFWAVIVGVTGWDGNLGSPLRVRARGIDVLFEQAWHYLVPTAVLLLASLTSALTGGVWLVRNPAPRGAPF